MKTEAYKRHPLCQAYDEFRNEMGIKWEERHRGPGGMLKLNQERELRTQQTVELNEAWEHLRTELEKEGLEPWRGWRGEDGWVEDVYPLGKAPADDNE